MKTIITFLLGVLVGAGGLVVWQRPGTALIVSRLFPTQQRLPPQIVPMGQIGCEPPAACRGRYDEK